MRKNLKLLLFLLALMLICTVFTACRGHDDPSAENSQIEESAGSNGNHDRDAGSVDGAIKGISKEMQAFLPAVTYAMPLSGTDRVAAYTDSTLQTQVSGCYVKPYSEEIVLTKISDDGRALEIVCLAAGKAPCIYWFKTEDILGVTNVDLESYTASASANTYRTTAKTTVGKYGAINSGDLCVKLGSRKVGDGTYYPTIYKISATTRNGVSDVAYKLALIPAEGTTPPTAPTVSGTSDVADDSYVSKSVLESTVSAYGISTSSNAYKCLLSINGKYGAKLTVAQKKGVAVFLFEGVGSSSSVTKRMNAMCVVVKNGKIVYLSKNCTTIPDYPFNPAKNDGTPMPTLMSGIYSFTTTNHLGKYAALNVSGARAVRFRSKSDYYQSGAEGINVHRRSIDSIAASSATWVNSAGCQLIGVAGTASSGEYASFIKAIGIVGSSATGASKYSAAVSGKIIIDRTYAESYLKNVGYAAGAITMLNKNQVK